jgi:folate-dependent tRNA-U54 methylase TrmFO/GidA
MSAMLVSLESFRVKMAQTVANGCDTIRSSHLKSTLLARAGTPLKTTSNGLATMRDQLALTLTSQLTRETLIKVIRRDGTLSLAMSSRD